MMFISKL